MNPRRNAAFGFAASVALHGAAVAAALAFGGGWWGEARLAMGTAAPTPTLWPVVWIDEVPEPQKISEPSPEPAQELATGETAAPPPASKPETIEPKRQAKVPAPNPKRKPEPVSDKGPADVKVADAAVAEASDPTPPAKTERAESPQEKSDEGSGTSGLELAALPPPAPAPATAGWSVEARVPPIYPLSARRRGAEGKVVLRAEIGSDGTPTSVQVVRGSGHAELDAAARQAVEKWRFRAPTNSGVEIPIVFQLENR